MEEEITNIIAMSCERMVPVPMEAKRIAAKEITSHMKKFIRWIGENELYRNKGKNGQWTYKSHPYIIWKTDEELYQFWLHSLKNKKMKYSIKERAKKVPLRIKIMVRLHMIWIDLKHLIKL
jgi:hypothetical protein